MYPHFSIERALKESFAACSKQYKVLLKFFGLSVGCGVLAVILSVPFFALFFVRGSFTAQKLIVLGSVGALVILGLAVLCAVWAAASESLSFKLFNGQDLEQMRFRDFFAFDFSLARYLALAGLSMGLWLLTLAPFGAMALCIVAQIKSINVFLSYSMLPPMFFVGGLSVIGILLSYFATRNVIYQKQGVVASLAESARLTTGIRLKLLGFEVGAIGCCMAVSSILSGAIIVGPIITSVASLFIMITRTHIYLQVLSFYQNQESAPIATDNQV